MPCWTCLQAAPETKPELHTCNSGVMEKLCSRTLPCMHVECNVCFCVFLFANHCQNYFPIARNYLMAIYCVHEQFPQCTLHTHLKKMPLLSWSFFCFTGLRRSCCCRQQCAAGGRRRLAGSRGSFFGHCCARRRHCCTSAHYAAG